MKHTSLHGIHAESKASLVPFADWEMPLSYAGTAQEVLAVRTTAGIFDVSHMGEVRITGPGAKDFIQRVCSNDVNKLRDRRAQYSLLLNPQGGVIDDVIVYRFNQSEYLVVVNAGCKTKDLLWLEAQANGLDGVILTDESYITALIAVQGPKAFQFVQSVSNEAALSAMGRFDFRPCELADQATIVSRTGYTGEDGFEIFCAWDAAPSIWQAFIEVGCVPAGLGARDVLRLEAAYPLYGHELDETHSPYSSGVAWAVKPNKGSFIGRDKCIESAQNGSDGVLIGLKTLTKAIPRQGCLIYSDKNSSPCGIVTSGTLSAVVGTGIALARVNTTVQTSEKLQIDIRGRRTLAEIVALPFFRNGV